MAIRTLGSTATRGWFFFRGAIDHALDQKDKKGTKAEVENGKSSAETEDKERDSRAQAGTCLESVYPVEVWKTSTLSTHKAGVARAAKQDSTIIKRSNRLLAAKRLEKNGKGDCLP